MNELNENLLKKIESVLKIKLYDWQKDYILERPQILDMRITGRCTGKTLAYIIKTLFSDEKPIRAYEFKEIEAYSDWFSVTIREERNDRYTHCFKAYMKETYEKLLKNHIEPRKIFFSRREEENYYREQMRINFRVNIETCPSCGEQKYWEDEYHCRNCGKNLNGGHHGL